jgi:hypothetical protein
VVHDAAEEVGLRWSTEQRRSEAGRKEGGEDGADRWARLVSGREHASGIERVVREADRALTCGASRRCLWGKHERAHAGAKADVWAWQRSAARTAAEVRRLAGGACGSGRRRHAHGVLLWACGGEIDKRDRLVSGR